MRKQGKMIISLLLTVCMMFGLSAVCFAEEAPAALDYDTAADGDLLYTVDFSRKDGVTARRTDYTTANVTVQTTISPDGHEIRFSNKAAGETLYTCDVKKYPITDHIYTLSYYLEYTADNVRSTVGFLYDGGVNVKNKGQVTTIAQSLTGGKLDPNTFALNYGTNTGYTVQKSVTRLKEAVGNATREYFKIVIDGTRMLALIYVLDTNRTYQLQANYAIRTDAEDFSDWLTPSFINYDAIPGDNYIALGDMTVHKGNCINQTPSFVDVMQQKQNGDIIYSVDFTDNTTYKWNKQNATVVSADTMKLPNVTNKEVSLTSLALPYGEQFMLEDHTMELYVSSNYANNTNGRVGLHVLASGSHTFGFLITPDTSAPARMFARDTAFITETDADLTSYAQWKFRVEPIIHQPLKDFKLDTSDDSKPNVKVEFNSAEHTVTLWELSSVSGKFEKISSLRYSTGNIYYEALRIRTWGSATTDITVKNVQVKKGLTAVGFDGNTTALRAIQSTDVVNDAASVRFIAVIDTLAYARVGFVVSVVWKDAEGKVYTGETINLSTTSVLTSVVDKNGVRTKAGDFGGSYLFALRVDSIPMGENVQVDFVLKPYTVDSETREQCFGNERTVSFINGIYTENAAPLTK